MNFKERLTGFCNKYKLGLIMFLIGAIVVIWDMLTKAITDGEATTIINGVISFFSTHNTGAAWSMLNNHTWLLVLISCVFLAVIFYANWKFKKKNLLYSFSLGLIISGALCNLFDRVVFGYVRDFISLDFLNFPIFNIADCAITIGVIMLIIFFIILWVKEDKEEKKSENKLAAQVTKNNQSLNGLTRDNSENKEKRINTTRKNSTSKKVSKNE